MKKIIRNKLDISLKEYEEYQKDITRYNPKISNIPKYTCPFINEKDNKFRSIDVSAFSNYFQKLIIVPKYEPKKVIRENYKIDKTKFVNMCKNIDR